MRSILLAASIGLLTFSGHTQTCAWAHQLGNVNTVTSIKQVRAYQGSMALVCGNFAAPTLTLGTQIVNNSGQDDAFLALTDADGNYTWALGIGGTNIDMVADVASHSSGAFAAAGSFRSVFLPIGSTTLANAGESDVWFAKFNADRTVAWVRHWGGTDIDEVTSVRADADGNWYVAGQEINKFTLQTIRVILRKYSPSGTLIWERQGTVQSGSAAFLSLTVDDAQNIRACGSMYGSTTFGSNTLNGDQGYTAFLVSYDPTGSLINAMISNDNTEFSAIESHGEHIYACARKINYNIGWGWPLADSKIKLVKLDGDLNTVWSREFGGEDVTLSLDLAKNLSVDADGNAYVTGSYFSDTLFFADDTLINPYNAPYYYPQIFVAKYSSDGDALWGLSAGGIHSDEGTGIAVFGEDRFYLAGHFESDPAVLGDQELENTGQLDSIYVHLFPARYGRKTMGFLAKFDADGITGITDRDGLAPLLAPNPTTGSITVRASAEEGPILAVEVLTLDGRVVHRASLGVAAPMIQLELKELTPGTYLLAINTPQRRYTERFIKH
ncbi:MAG: T9SS type A sorting domain-containing protein [Flavobacteriales bacterium]